MIRAVLIALLASLVFTAPAASAQTVATPTVEPARLQALFTKIETGDASLESYRAAVDFTIGLHSFPFIRKSVHGTAYYKRPNRLELVTERLPSYARNLEHLFVSLGSPASWQVQFTVALADEGTPNEHIRLVPKMTGSRVRWVEIHLDEPSGLPAKIVWMYTNGRIEMHQTIAKVAGHYVIVAQDADMHYPAVHAYMRTRIHDFEWNVAVDDAVFTEPVLLNP
jgi:hypothetical protein